MEPDRISIDLGWGRVACLSWQPDAPRPTPPVVLLHGGGVDNAELSWGEVGAALADAGHRVFAPDHPGYGRSPLAPWTATQDRLVEYVAELLDELGLDAVVLGGLSLGGGMALGCTLAHPGRVRGLMLFGSYGLMDHQYGGWLAVPAHVATWAMLHTGLLGLVTKAYARNRRLMTSGLRGIVRNPLRLTPQLIDAVMAEGRRPDAFVAFEQWQRDQILRARARTNYTPRLPTVGVPTLVVHGTHDSGVPIDRAREAARLLPDATLRVVEGAGHWVQRDRPDRVIPVVEDFLRRVPAR